MLCLHDTHAWCLRRPEEGVGSLRTSDTDGCELPCECWEPNPSPMQEQPLL